MSDVWADAQSDADLDPWMTWVPIILYVIGGLYVLLGLMGVAMVVFGAFMALSGGGNASDAAVTGGIFAVEGIFILGICGGIGALNLAAGWGFKRERKWAWFAALILGAMYAPSACLPFGAALLYGCLNDKTRNRFLKPAAAAMA